MTEGVSPAQPAVVVDVQHRQKEGMHMNSQVEYQDVVYNGSPLRRTTQKVIIIQISPFLILLIQSLSYFNRIE